LGQLRACNPAQTSLSALMVGRGWLTVAAIRTPNAET